MFGLGTVLSDSSIISVFLSFKWFSSHCSFAISCAFFFFSPHKKIISFLPTASLLNCFEMEFTRRLSNKWAKAFHQDYSLVLQTSLSLFKYLAAPNIRNKCLTSYETLESPGEIKLLMEYYLCLYNFCERGNLFPLLPMGNCFRYYFRQLFISLALEKCKKVCKILKKYSDIRLLIVL